MCASSFPQGLLWENPPSSGPAHTRGDYIFYLALLGSIFLTNSRLMCNEPRKKPSQCMRESTTVIALCEQADRAPSLASATTQILFHPCRTICQYPGIYRSLILAGHRAERVCVCCECVFCVATHKDLLHFNTGGRRWGPCRNSCVQITLRINHAE